MATYYFLDSNGTNDWGDPLNWNTQSDGLGTTGTIPGSGDDAVVLAMVLYATSGSPTVTNLTVEGSGTITGISVTAVSTLVQSGGSLGDNCYIVGPVTVASGGIIGGSDNMNFASVTGTLTFSGSGSTVSGSTSSILSVSADVIFGSTWTGTAEYINIGGNIIYTYGYSGSTNNITVTGSSFYAGYPTLYFYNSMSTDWGNVPNWWVDSGHSQQAFSIPDSTQDVILDSDVTSDSSGAATANNITVNYNGMNTGRLLISVTVVSTTIFSNDTFYGDGTTSITLTSPTVTFNGNSYLAANASIVGNVNFYDTSANNGSITGDATVYSNHPVPFDSSHGNTGTISGSIIYSGYSPRTVYYYHGSSSEDWGNINYWWTDSSHSTNVDYIPNGDIALDTVIVEASIASNTYGYNTIVGSLSAGGSVWIGISISCGEASFTDNFIFGYGNPSAVLSHLTATNNITFNDLSSNEGIINANYPAYPVEFTDSSTNDGTINGDVDVYYPSEKPVGGTVNGTVTYYGHTLYFAGMSNDGDWNNPNNWYLDAGGTNLYGILPSEIIPYQDVVIVSNVTSYTGTGMPSAANLSTYGTYPYVDNIDIIVYDLATFSEETYLGSAGIITGNALFKDLATNRGGNIAGYGTFELTAAAQMISNGYDGTYGAVEFQYGKGINGSSILGLV